MHNKLIILNITSISFSKPIFHYNNLTVDTDTFEIVDSLKLLGMTVSKELKWNTHIDY